MVRGESGMVDRELAREVMMYIPTVVGWIEKGQDITEADVRNLREVVPNHLEYGLNISFEEVVKWNERYLSDPAWKEYVKVMLSDKGKDWLKRNLNLLRKYSDGR